MKALLLENISDSAKTAFVRAGFEVESLPSAIDASQLNDKLAGVAMLGIRSKTSITTKVLDARGVLLAIGAFCIGATRSTGRSAAAGHCGV